MIQLTNLTLQFGERVLYKDINIKFTEGNCYGIIGANGVGKSTLLRVITGEIEPNKGEVFIAKNKRVSALNQNQNAFDQCTVRETVMRGHKRLFEIMQEKEKLYTKENFSDEDGIKLGELESEFEELNGWNAESDAESLLNSLNIDKELFDKLMVNIEPKLKVKVLLAQCLFGNPDILILDEPTNNLDFFAEQWLEEYLMNLDATILIVSHNRYFLNKVCTHICDIDYKSINIFVGNYDFWYESSQLLIKQAKETNKKAEMRIKELQDFIARFSANASKSKQATSRKREIEKIKLEEIKPSSRRFPYVEFAFENKLGNDLLRVENLTKKGFFEDISFSVAKDQKIAFLCDKTNVVSMLFDCLADKEKADSGKIEWGKTINLGYMPSKYDHFFEKSDLNLIDWLKQYSKDKHEEYLRGFLGRMLFSGQEVFKKANVLSGGEKARCMLSRIMLSQANFLILDEPTNHLDLESITALNKGMINFKGNILFYSSDREMLSSVGNRIIEIRNGKKVGDKVGDYFSFLAK